MAYTGNPDDLDEMEQSAKRYAALMDARAGGWKSASGLDNSDQTNIPEDQATARQPGSGRIASMFKGTPAPDVATDTSSSASSTTAISRPDFTRRDELMTQYEKEAQGYPTLLRFRRDAADRKLHALQSAIQMEEAKASGDIGAQQKYLGVFDPKRLGNPLQGRGPDGTLKYFQDVFSRDPTTGAGKMDYQDTGIQPPMDIRKNVLARGGARGGMVVTPTGDGGYTTETYQNEPDLPGGGAKSVPGGYVDAERNFHKTVEPGQGGAGSVKGLTAILNGVNASYQIGGPAKMKEHIDALREAGVPIDEILGQAAAQYGNRGGVLQPPGGAPALAPPPGAAPGTSAPPPMPRPAAPPGPRGKVTPNDAAAAAPPGPGGLKATNFNPQTGQYAAQDPSGKWVTWGGAPAAQRGMGR